MQLRRMEWLGLFGNEWAQACRTIDPRSRQGQDILRLYTTEHHDDAVPAEASEAASS